MRRIIVAAGISLFFGVVFTPQIGIGLFLASSLFNARGRIKAFLFKDDTSASPRVLNIAIVLFVLMALVVVAFGNRNTKSAAEKYAIGPFVVYRRPIPPHPMGSPQQIAQSIASLAIDSYRLDVGSYPAELKDLVENPGYRRWRGPYLPKGIPPSWNEALKYIANKDGHELRTAGTDKVFFTADDEVFNYNERSGT